MGVDPLSRVALGMTPLRDYQQRAIADCRSAYRDGSRAPVLVMPTGSGKTRVGVDVARSHLERVRAGSVLWIAHRVELLDQARSRLEAEGADMHRTRVESIQTLLRMPELPPSTLVVLDECHHYAAAEWSRIAQHYSGAIRLGLTATPERGDGAALGDIFDRIVRGPAVAELTERGLLVPCDVMGPSRRQRKAVAGGGPLESYLRHCRGKRTVIYCATVQHAEETATEFRAAGIDCAIIEGCTHERERATALERFAAGELTALLNVHVLTEGWDCPATECIIVARGVGHAGTGLQMVGRGLRPSPGKDRCLVLDLAGNWTSQTGGLPLPTDPVEYSLDGQAIRKLKDLPPLRQCQACGATYRAGTVRACPRCGFALPVYVPHKTRDELQAMAQREPPEKRERYWEHLLTEERTRGYKRGWAYYRYKAKYGQEPGGLYA
jgi:DNA repair protein RadD